MGETATGKSELFFPSTGRILLTAVNKSMHPASSEDAYGKRESGCDNCIQTPLLEPAQGILVPVEIQQIMKSHAKVSISFQQG